MFFESGWPYKGKGVPVEPAIVPNVMAPLNGRDCG